MKFAIFFSIFVLFAGCTSKGPGELTISGRNLSIQQEFFEFTYPESWEVESSVDNSDPELHFNSYIFYPKDNKNFYIRIEHIVFLESKADADTHLRKVLGNKMRKLQKIYYKEGYKDFTFKESTGRLGGYRVKKLITKGSRKGIKRQNIVMALSQLGNVYAVSYQWYSSWDIKTRKKAEKMIGSIRFTR